MNGPFRNGRSRPGDQTGTASKGDTPESGIGDGNNPDLCRVQVGQTASDSFVPIGITKLGELYNEVERLRDELARDDWAFVPQPEFDRLVSDIYRFKLKVGGCR
jgi:hypothetical protein